ncbi:ATP-binding protein [Actinomadura meridiana]|uniref:ATP-binding protein n=1 Tax=Actinomadura meridiana TaxID=559626 RepID=A0ABP8CA84_9ACTN
MAESEMIVIKAELGAVREAREFVGLVFGGWGLTDYVARTVVSELAASAVVHGCGGEGHVIVRAYRREDGIPVVEAWDRSDAAPLVRPVTYGVECGRGLLIVEGLVRRWGTRPLNEGGKVVWAEIDPVPA